MSAAGTGSGQKIVMGWHPEKDAIFLIMRLKVA